MTALRNESDAIAAADRLRALRELGKNKAFLELQALFESKRQEHTNGISDRSITAEKRAEHLEAFHALNDLCEWANKLETALDRDLREWSVQQTEINSRILDGLG